MKLEAYRRFRKRALNREDDVSEATEVVDAEVVDLETGEIMDTRNEVANLPAIQREKVGGLLRPVAKPEDVLAAQEEVRGLVEKALKVDRDFGTIPGTSKPTLLKPGAERINAAFGVRPRYRIVEREVDHDREVHWTKRKKKWANGKFAGWEEESGVSLGLYRYVVECELVHRESGVPVGQGMGSCSTMESKYVDRPRECENVALKMGQKRALIAATLNAYGLSDQFTQDVEDLDGFGGSESSGPLSLDDEVAFGKHSGSTWGELVENEAGYVRWCIGNLDRLSIEDKDTLRDALDGTSPAGLDALAEEVKKTLDAAATLGAITTEQAGRVEEAIEEKSEEHLRTSLNWLRQKMELAKAGAKKAAGEVAEDEETQGSLV